MDESDYHQALNEASWDMMLGLQEHGPINGHQFNAMKSVLKKAIETYHRHLKNSEIVHKDAASNDVGFGNGRDHPEQLEGETK